MGANKSSLSHEGPYDLVMAVKVHLKFSSRVTIPCNFKYNEIIYISNDT